MKKFITLTVAFLIFALPVFSAKDTSSEEYLKSKKHISIVNPLAEKIVEKAILHSLKKETKGKYKVKFEGYTLSSMKKGIFKYLEITGKKVKTKDIEIPYFNIKSASDYNWIDYNQHPIVFKSDMVFDTVTHFSENSINDALNTEEYLKILRKVNKRTYPMFTLNSVKVKIKNNKMYIIIGYNFPISPKEKDRTFMVSSKLKVVNNKIQTYDVAFNEAYGNLPLYKVTNLVNLLNPLNFTVKLFDDKNCDVNIEDIKIKDDIVIVNGKMYIKGDK